MKQLLLIAALFISVAAMAQTGSLSGKIIDNNNEPLEAVTISIQNNKFSSLTNSEGLFSITSIPSGKYAITLSYVGKETQKQNVNIEAGKATVLNLQLNTASSQLNEVVVKATNNTKYIRTTSEFASRQNIPWRSNYYIPKFFY